MITTRCRGLSGLGKAKTSVMSMTGSATARGPEMWSDTRRCPSCFSIQPGQPIQGGQARHEKVLAAAKHIERLDAVNATPDRHLRNREGWLVLLETDDGVAFVTQAHERAVSDPFLLEEFEGTHRLGAQEQEI